jgi:LysM repeat protein
VDKDYLPYFRDCIRIFIRFVNHYIKIVQMQRFLLIVSIFVVSQFLYGQTPENTKHIVGDGESLYSISKKYHTSVAKLIELNPQVDDGIKTGMELLIPTENKATLKNEEAPLSPTAEKPHVEERPQTEQAITIKVAEPTNDSESAPEYHTVAEGETYYSLSRKYKTTVSNLMTLNNNAPLKMGEKIVISKKTAAIQPKSEAPKSEPEPLVIEEKVDPKPKEETPKQSEEPKVEEVVKTPKKDAPKETEDAGKEPVASPKVEKYADKTVITAAATDIKIPAVEAVAYNNAVKRILIIPFDPYLYFSDADMEIAKQSKMEHTKIRQAFRRRLNALLEPQGYETIHLLGGRIKDSLTDLNRIYKNVSYNYQDALYNPNAQVQRTQMEDGQLKEADKTHVEKSTNDPLGNSRASLAKDESKYYGVKISEPNFFPYFNSKYQIDYYIFVNQFEVKTNYATCLDRTTKNYERNFITHFSIFDNTGKQISGNRIKIHYESNENNIQKILTANMQKVANMIIGELPPLK